MKKLTASALALAVALSTGAAFAHGLDWKQDFKKTDTNGDGYVSLAEFNAASTAKFHEIDADNDGRISLDEKKDYLESKYGKITGADEQPSATKKLNPDNTTPAEAKR